MATSLIKLILQTLAGIAVVALIISVWMAHSLPVDSLRLPPGFDIQVYARDITDARSMDLSPSGVLYIGSRRAGRVYALIDSDGDYHAETVHIVAAGLEMPIGVAFRNGDLFVAEATRILKFENVESRLGQPLKPTVVYAGFPRQKSHGWKFIAFGPDGLLYVPVGAPCNVCIRANDIFSTITRINVDEPGEPEVVARGIRNSIGFDWHPFTNQLWFTDNGRDWMGDDLPPDELNLVSRADLHFGFPYCHGGSVIDPQYGSPGDCEKYDPPQRQLPAHAAPMGMEFYRGTMFPKKYQNQIFIAEHGSWNRSEPIGYRVTLVRLKGNRAVSYETFIDGWLNSEGKKWGRPVDIEIMPDGSMLVSDDTAGAIYRISYSRGEGSPNENDGAE